MRPIPFFLLLSFLLISTLPGPACAENVSIKLSDLNLVGRDISIYQVSESGSSLVYQGNTSSTLTLDSAYSYQITVEPDKYTWFDDPRDTFDYFINTAAGQSIAFILILLMFGGIIKLIFR